MMAWQKGSMARLAAMALITNVECSKATIGSLGPQTACRDIKVDNFRLTEAAESIRRGGPMSFASKLEPPGDAVKNLEHIGLKVLRMPVGSAPWSPERRLQARKEHTRALYRRVEDLPEQASATEQVSAWSFQRCVRGFVFCTLVLRAFTKTLTRGSLEKVVKDGCFSVSFAEPQSSAEEA